MTNDLTLENLPQPTEMKHHEFAPSSLQRICACPASYKVCKDWKNPDSYASERGTRLHQAVWNDAVYAELSDSDKAPVDYIRRAHIAPYPAEKGYTHLHERSIRISGSDGNELTFGTCDFILLDATRTIGMVKDWKFGATPVPKATENLQLIAYSVGLMQTVPSLQTVFAQIVQPVFDIQKEEAGEVEAPDAVAEFTRDRLPTLLSVLEGTIAKAREADLSDASCYVVSPENCRFCNRLACRIHRAWMERNLSALSLGDEAALALAETQEGKMTVEYANALLLAKKAVEEAMEAKAKVAQQAIILAGGSVDYRVAEGRVTKRTDWKAVAEEAGVPDSLIEEHTTYKQGEPYLMPRARRPRLPASVTRAIEGN